MGSEYKLRINNASGVLQAEIQNYTWLGYVKSVGKEGFARFGLPDNHSLIPLLALDWQIEVWRRNTRAGIDWYRDCLALYQDFDRDTYSNGLGRFEAWAAGEKELLRRRYIAWAANTANRSVFAAVPAETIMKTLVQYNSTGSATTGAGRKADGTPSGYTITIQADAGGGLALGWNCMGDNLLESLYALSLIGGGDYDLVKTGAATFDFRFYAGQRGTDRSATLTFAPEYGNMGAPTLSYRRRDEKTQAIVAGAGVEAARAFRVRTGPNYSAANKKEAWVDQRNTAVTAELDAAGDEVLESVQATVEAGFTVVQSPASEYGVHYCVGGVMGDLATVRPFGVESIQKIDEVAVSLTPGEGERIAVRLINV